MSATARATPKNVWTPEEDAIVLDDYAARGVDATWRRLPRRTRDAVKQRAITLGVTAPRRSTQAPDRPNIGKEGWLTEPQAQALGRLRDGWVARQPRGTFDPYHVRLRSPDGTDIESVPERTLRRLVQLELVACELTDERKVWRAVT